MTEAAERHAAHHRAVGRLVARHAKEFAELTLDELNRIGLQPVPLDETLERA